MITENIIVFDYPSFIKDTPLTKEEKRKLIDLNETLINNIKSLDIKFSKIIDEHFWELI